MILNVGCGEETYGDVRVDLYKTSTSTMNFDCDKPFPLENSSFDTVYTKSFFEYLLYPHDFLKESFRVLKPKGNLVLITDNAGYWRYHYKGFFGSPTHVSYKGKYGEDDKHYALYNMFHLSNHLTKVGFEITNCQYMSPKKKTSELQCSPQKKVDRLLVHVLGKPMTMLHVLIEGVKPE